MPVSQPLVWLSKRLASFKHAFQGIATLCRTQPNFIIHLVLGSIAVGAAIILQFSRIEWMLLILTITTVIVAEAFNSAVEFLTDLTSPNFHPLAKKAKDVAAASVLLAAIGAVVMASVLYLPKLVSFLE
ncbi:MAG: diacylglycerol kinase family protein [Bacteroidota bacterium]